MRAPSRRRARWTPPVVVPVLGLAAVYLAAAKLGLSWAFLHPSASPVWPPTGIAIAALLLLGRRLWPGIFLGAFLANVTTAGTVATSLGIAAGNTLEAVAAAFLVTRWAGGARAFERAADVFRYALLAAVLCTAISATAGTLSLALGGFVRWADYEAVWFTWWLGDAAGALVVAPLILLWAAAPRAAVHPARLAEAAAVLLATLALGDLVFRTNLPVAFTVVPLLAWTAFRLGPRETATVIASLSVVAVWHTLAGTGPFAREDANTSLLLLQGFLGTMAMVNLPLAAVVAERRQVLALLQESESRFRTLYYRERGVAEVLQRSLLPRALPEIPGVSMAARYLPAHPVAVGGDWYDVIVLPGGELGLAIGDVAGRGAEAAAVMGKLRHTMRAYIAEEHHPERMLQRLSEVMEAGEMATLFYAVVDLLAWKVRYVSAGHPPALLISPAGTPAFLEGSGLPLGTALARRYREQSAELAPGSTLLLYTDGLVETRADPLDGGMQRLRTAAGRLPASSPEDAAARIVREVLQGRLPEDDVALLLVAPATLDSARLSLRLPAVPASLREVRHALRRWLAPKGLNEQEVLAMLVAAGEACANAVEHAYGPGQGAFQLEARDEGGVVTIAVSDTGSWRRSGGRGRGLQIMHGLMDAVDIQRTEAGTTVRLIRDLRVRVRS